MDFDWLKNKANQIGGEIGSAISTGVHDIGHGISVGVHDVGGAITHIGGAIEHGFGINTPSPTQGNINISHPAQPMGVNLSAAQPTQPNLSLNQNPMAPRNPFTPMAPNLNNRPVLNIKKYTPPLPVSTSMPMNGKGMFGQPVINLAHANQKPQQVHSQGHGINIGHDILSAGKAVGKGALNFGESMVRPVVALSADYSRFAGNLGTMAAGGKPQSTSEFYKGTPLAPQIASFAGGQNIGQKITPQQQAAYENQLNSGRNVAANVAQAGIMSLTGPLEGGIGARLAETALPKVGAKILSGAATGAITGGPFNIAALGASNAPLTAHNIASAYAQGTGYGTLFGAGFAAAPAGIGGLVKVGKNLHSIAGEPALQAAEKASGLSRSSLVNDNEAQSLHDFAQNGNLNQHTKTALDTAGIDTSGAPQDVIGKINAYLDQRSNFIKSHSQVSQGGYVGGQRATGFNESQLNNKTFQGAEGLPRFEGDDSRATINIHNANSKPSDIVGKPTTRVPINQLSATDLQEYGELDRPTVDLYKQEIASGKLPEPILTMRGKDGMLHVEDGKNRLAALTEMGAKNVAAKIVTPEDIKAIGQASAPSGGLSSTLGGTLNHPSLFRDYPQLADVKVKVFTPKNERLYGGYHKETNTVYVNQKLLANPKLLKTTLLHETQHAIQNIEGFAQGTTAKRAGSVGAYKQSPGEQEAFNVGKRINLSPQERAANPFQAKITSRIMSETKAAPFAASEGDPINLNKGAFSKEDTQYLESLSDEQKSELSPREQMALFEPKTELNPPETNTARNPQKANIPVVQPGDYAQARTNPQIASAPVEYAGGQWIKSMRKLTPDERGNFWRAVEKPNGKYSPQLTEAIDRWRDVDNRIHANSQELGGNTNYLTDHSLHPWMLPEKYDEFLNNGGNPDKFPGINNLSRKYRTIEEGEAAGLKLGNDPVKEGLNYIGASSTLLKRRALYKSLIEADRGEDTKPYSFDVGGGKSVPLSEKGVQAAKGYERVLPGTKIGNTYRKTLVRPTKQTLLSASQFHPVNISVLKAGPALALKGHPVLAIKGVYGTFRSQFGRGYSDALQQQALKDGTVDFGARVNAPMKFGSDYANEGKLAFGHAGLGEKTIFEKAMPAMQYRMLQGLKADLNSKGIAVDSAEAKSAGTRINEVMGFVNTETRNLSKRTQRQLTNILLAPQFTRAKWATIHSALTEQGLGGSYARAAVIGNTAMDLALLMGLGYLAKQKSDSVRDMLIRSIFQPAIPTNQKDKNGNTMEYRLPASYTSEALGLVFTVNRGNDGHLQVAFKPNQLGQNLENYGRARLNIPFATGLKIATNTNYAGKPLFDPNAPLGTRIQQGATTVGTGLLPIGLQGIAQTGAVKNHLPQNVQQVINANSPGSNPLLKSVISSFGATPVTDKTVGKGLQTTQYFNALDTAKKGLNRQEKDAIDLFSGSKKNPVTGAYDIMPNVNDQRAKAAMLLQNPNVIDHLMSMNQTLSNDGQRVDPLWQQSKDKIVAYLQYQAMAPGGPDQVNWRNTHTWYTKGNDSLSQQRQTFFSSLPPGDPNRPKQPIEYPTPNAQVAQEMNQYFNLYNSDPKQAGQYLRSHQDVQDQMDKQATYTNQLRQAEGYGALRTYPKPSPYVQAILDAMPQGNDLASRRARALAYQDPQVAAWSQEDAIYNLTKGAGLAQIQGNSLTSKTLKATQSLQYDILKNPDGTLSLKYSDAQGGKGATPIQSGAVAISGGGSSSRKSSKKKMPMVPFAKRLKVARKHSYRRPHLKKERVKNIHLHKTSYPSIKIKHQGPLKASSVIHVG